MTSKEDRVQTSMENIELTTNFLIKEIENRFYTHKKSKKECYDIVNQLMAVRTFLSRLRFEQPFENKKLDQIRSIHLSLMNLYEKEDYDTLNGEISKVNNNLCKDAKERDRTKLNDFKRKYNSLSPFYQSRLSKVEKTPNGKLALREKGLDNVKFLTENYLNVKYNLKKVKYEEAGLSDMCKSQIASCKELLKTCDSEDMRVHYSALIEYINNYGSAEVVVNGLQDMASLCEGAEFLSLKKLITEMEIKYKLKFYNNTKSYGIEMFNQMSNSSIKKELK